MSLLKAALAQAKKKQDKNNVPSYRKSTYTHKTSYRVHGKEHGKNYHRNK